MKNVKCIIFLFLSIFIDASENQVTREESRYEIKYSDNTFVAIYYKKRKAYMATEKVLTKLGLSASFLKNPKYYFEMLERQYLDQQGTPEAKEFKEPGQMEELEFQKNNEND